MILMCSIMGGGGIDRHLPLGQNLLAEHGVAACHSLKAVCDIGWARRRRSRTVASRGCILISRRPPMPKRCRREWMPVHDAIRIPRSLGRVLRDRVLTAPAVFIVSSFL